MPTVTYGNNCEYLEEVKFWLRSEYEETKSGFYINWEAIEELAKVDKIIFLKHEIEIIGFVCWSDYGEVAKIQIMEIKKSWRNRGFGRNLISSLTDYLRGQKNLVLRLECSPKASDIFWEKLGFDIYNVGYSSVLERYKLLIPLVQGAKIELSENNTNVELNIWRDEYSFKRGLPHQIRVKSSLPEELKDNTPIIILPARYDWFIEIIYKERKVLYKGIIKYCKIDLYSKGFLFVKPDGINELLGVFE